MIFIPESGDDVYVSGDDDDVFDDQRIPPRGGDCFEFAANRPERFRLSMGSPFGLALLTAVVLGYLLQGCTSHAISALTVQALRAATPRKRASAWLSICQDAGKGLSEHHRKYAWLQLRGGAPNQRARRSVGADPKRFGRARVQEEEEGGGISGQAAQSDEDDREMMDAAREFERELRVTGEAGMKGGDAKSSAKAALDFHRAVSLFTCIPTSLNASCSSMLPALPALFGLDVIP